MRCYWALLAPTYTNDAAGNPKLELKFVYMDPVLGAHLAAQKMSMLQRGVIEFIHPGERERELACEATPRSGGAEGSQDSQATTARRRRR